jgi:hypothetical protein
MTAAIWGAAAVFAVNTLGNLSGKHPATALERRHAQVRLLEHRLDRPL